MGMIDEVREYFNKTNFYKLAGARFRHIHTGNHTIYEVEGTSGMVFCLRWLTEESYRRDDFMPMEAECLVLNWLSPLGIVPITNELIRRLSVPVLIQEFLPNVVSYNQSKPLSDEHIALAARAIAVLNSKEVFPWMYVQLRETGWQNKPDSYGGYAKVWIARMAYSVLKTRQKDVLVWIAKMCPVVFRAWRVLRQYDTLLAGRPAVFHFDGAHCGNVCLHPDGRVVFLDWESVSFRRTPAFTAARFLVSTDEKGVVNERHVQTFLTAYLERLPVSDFETFLRADILLKSVSDMVWVVRNWARAGAKGSVKATGIAVRYQNTRDFLAKF